MDRTVAYSTLFNASMALTTTPKRFTLIRGTAEARSTNFPGANADSSGGYANLDHLEASVSAIAGGCANLTARFTWDTAGDEGCQPPTAAALHVGITTGTKGTAFWGIDSRVVVPTGKTLYCWLSTDAGTATLDAGRLFWSL